MVVHSANRAWKQFRIFIDPIFVGARPVTQVEWAQLWASILLNSRMVGQQG